jgi:RNA polymerase sigma-54 factor
VEQMLDDNPFLELDPDEAAREEFGLAQADTPVSEGEREAEIAPNSIADYADSTGAGTKDDEVTPLGR